MSLKDDVAARGVKLSDLATELAESYGNLYTALALEHKGAEIRHKAVAARLEKVREWLGSERTAEARTIEAAVGAVDVRVLRARIEAWPVPPHWRVELEFAGVACGDVLKLKEGDDTCYYRVLRRVTNERAGRRWVDVYGGSGLDKDQKHYRLTRSFTMERLGLKDEEVAA